MSNKLKRYAFWEYDKFPFVLSGEVTRRAYPGSGEVALTDAGRSQAAETGQPLTTTDLQQRIVGKLDGPRAKVLRELVAIYPNAIDY